MSAVTDASADAARWMDRALALARLGRLSTRPNPAVGCVLVRDGQAVGEGWHRRAGEPHAEVHALRAAGERARGADCYVTLEPCAHQGRTGPCADALAAAGVARVWIAASDPNPRVAGEGVRRLRDAGIEVVEGVLAEAAEAINRGFLHRMRSGRPYVTVKLGASLDGRIAMASGESQWITSAAARADVQRQRARVGAILTGVDTVIADDPRLTVRGADAALIPEQPLRVVADSQLRTPAGAAVLTGEGPCRIYCGVDPGTAGAALASASLRRIGTVGDRLDLTALLQDLGRQEVNDLLVEAGPRLTGALLAGNLVDELLLYVAPRLLGAQARPLAVLPGLERLADAPALDLVECRQVGPDLRLRLRPQRPG